MRLRTTVVLLATVVIALAEGSSSDEDARPPAVKLDKNLRRALLKALADLDTESAEQRSATDERSPDLEEIDLSSLRDQPANNEEPKSLDSIRGTIFSFDGFPSDEETPSEDKLQNSTFVEVDKYLATENSSPKLQKIVETSREENNNAFQTHDVVLPDKTSAIYDKSPEAIDDQLETRSVKTSSSSTVNVIDNNSNVKGLSNYPESLVISSSNGIATSNALVAPSPTAPSPTIRPQSNSTSSVSVTSSLSLSSSSSASSSSDSSELKSSETASKDKKEQQEVKIFQAPLVAAFTVQQDERGVPKSVVPIYRPSGDGQALTLQEQLDFKQKLLERQLAELQAQQIQQTQVLVRQQQIYEQQLRQKQQQQLFLQEQSRLKQIQEEQARLKLLEEQRNYQLQQQQQQQHQKVHQFSLNQHQTSLSLQPPFKTSTVNLQPSLTLELPNAALPPTFESSFHEQLRIQQLQRQQQLQQRQQQQTQLHQQQQQQQTQLHQQQQQQQNQLHQQQQQLQQQQRQIQLFQQQRLQQSFAPFPVDFQPPTTSSALRFNRQEAFGSVGNFGFNENRQQSNNRNHFGFNQQSRGPQTFSYNPYQTQQQLQQQQQQQFRPHRPQTPAKQIQHLLYQSGVAGDLGTVQGTGGQEDLNIVSKVLALNVGAVPTKALRYPGNNFGNAASNA